MFGKTYYFGMTRKFIVLFGTLFNDIKVQRKPAGGTDEILTVPLIYSPKDKMMARLFGDPALDRQVAAITPAMSFVLGSPYYDAERKLQSTLQRCYTSTANNVTTTSHQYVGIPYNVPCTLCIYSREEEDGLQILEQILPFFTPALTVNANLLPEMGFNIDVPIVLNSVDFQDDSYGDISNRRKLIWTLEFVMKVQFLGPLDNTKKIIRIIDVNINDQTTRNTEANIHITPGLTANGTPTSNASLSIPIDQIDANDNFGYVVEITETP